MISNHIRMHFCSGLIAYGYPVIVIWGYSPELSHSEEDGFSEKTRSRPVPAAKSGRGCTETDVLTGLESGPLS
jgi:hypothetical protein